MPPVLRALVGAAAATALVVAVGTLGSGPAAEDDAAAPPAPVPTSTPLAELDTDALAVRRAGFCAAVAPERVAEALGAEPSRAAAYDDGDRVALGAGVTDVAHEHGCAWTAADGTVARGWVFAPPVTPGQARELARDALRADGCARLPDAASFGTPSAGVLCEAGRSREAAYGGLWGDAWLSCSLRVPASSDTTPGRLADRTSRWCASVLVAAATDASTPGE
ncbi:hypothetical protein [Nocardioides dongkuii]|uniref:hypothetical protein n=1 Tax=Nocardioides dongkuii TaxID=2760089 RepID=UPI0015F7ACC4|nr:hypothetical protein [Nocardioides dongkuii]